MMNLAYELTRFEVLPAKPIPTVAVNAVSCPHCKAIDFAEGSKNQKCSACGMLYRVEKGG